MIGTRIAIVVTLASCVDYDPDVGPLQPAMGSAEEPALDPPGCSDSDPALQVSFARDIRPLTARSPGGCLFCHGGMTASGFNLGSYEALRRGGLVSGVRIVVPGKPCESILVQKLGVTPPFGTRMPYNGPPYFTSQELALVRDWIAEGASDN